MFFECCNTTHGVIAALVAAIHRGTSVICMDNATPVEPWITATSAVMTTFVSLPLQEQQPISLTGQQCNRHGNDKWECGGVAQRSEQPSFQTRNMMIWSIYLIHCETRFTILPLKFVAGKSCLSPHDRSTQIPDLYINRHNGHMFDYGLCRQYTIERVAMFSLQTSCQLCMLQGDRKQLPVKVLKIPFGEIKYCSCFRKFSGSELVCNLVA